MASDQLRIAGLTGVDLELQIAGPGSRSYAFLIDWHIRLLLAIAWFATVWLLLRAGGGVHGRASLTRAVVPAIAIYFLYHPILEVLMRGRSPGKRMAGVRLVTRSGGTPGPGALLVRNIFRLIDCLPTFYVVGLVTCMTTAQRVRIGDMAAGTLLVIDADASEVPLSQFGTTVGRTGLSPQAVELVHELLERWPSLATAQRWTLARALLARLGRADASTAADERELLKCLREVVEPQGDGSTHAR